MKFSEFKLNETILDALFYMNFEEATEIQIKAIPTILEGKDLIGCAQTGTGKTVLAQALSSDWVFFWTYRL